jgi:hypothetical protein
LLSSFNSVPSKSGPYSPSLNPSIMLSHCQLMFQLNNISFQLYSTNPFPQHKPLSLELLPIQTQVLNPIIITWLIYWLAFLHNLFSLVLISAEVWFETWSRSCRRLKENEGTGEDLTIIKVSRFHFWTVAEWSQVPKLLVQYSTIPSPIKIYKQLTESLQQRQYIAQVLVRVKHLFEYLLDTPATSWSKTFPLPLAVLPLYDQNCVITMYL